MSENIKGIMDTTLEKIRTMIDADVIVGKAIEVDGVTVVPVSKVSFGLASGGSDFPSKTAAKTVFGGGGGAGVNITPVTFLVIKNGNVKAIPITSEITTIDKAIDMVPDVVDKVTGFVNNLKSKNK